jgi:hypothetical protein
MHAALILAVGLVLETAEDGDPLRATVIASGAPEQAVLGVRRRTDDASGPGLFGTMIRNGDEIRFRPAVPLSPGSAYVAEVREGNRIRARLEWTTPGPGGSAPPFVSRLDPDGDVLPANLLKFYLQFSRPMREDARIFDRIHLEREDGSRVEDPWRRQELWTPDGTRLTLWIHPGRVKRGVNLREELGPVLEPGRGYALLVEPGAGLAALDGRTMERPFRHRFRTGPEDRSRPDPRAWSLAVPPAGSRDPLVVAFGERMDLALARRHLAVTDPEGRVVVWASTETRSGVGGDEIGWRPGDAWKSGEHRLGIADWIEDGAGNTPRRVFDRDLGERVGTAPPDSLRFVVRTPPGP